MTSGRKPGVDQASRAFESTIVPHPVGPKANAARTSHRPALRFARIRRSSSKPRAATILGRSELPFSARRAARCMSRGRRPVKAVRQRAIYFRLSSPRVQRAVSSAPTPSKCRPSGRIGWPWLSAMQSRVGQDVRCHQIEGAPAPARRCRGTEAASRRSSREEVADRGRARSNGATRPSGKGRARGRPGPRRRAPRRRDRRGVARSARARPARRLGRRGRRRRGRSASRPAGARRRLGPTRRSSSSSRPARRARFVSSPRRSSTPPTPRAATNAAGLLLAIAEREAEEARGGVAEHEDATGPLRGLVRGRQGLERDGERGVAGARRRRLRRWEQNSRSGRARPRSEEHREKSDREGERRESDEPSRGGGEARGLGEGSATSTSLVRVCSPSSYESRSSAIVSVTFRSSTTARSRATRTAPARAPRAASDLRARGGARSRSAPSPPS